MSKNKSAKAFTRGLTYHAGAGIGEAVRLLTTTGTVAAIAYITSKVTHEVKLNAIKKDVSSILKKK